MVKRIQFVTCLTAALGLAFLFMACGGTSGGGDVTYEGSTDPAVADSTTAAPLTEFAMGAVEAGFPLATPFVTPPPEMGRTAMSARPLADYTYTTTVIVPVPGGAVIDGSDYGKFGTGTVTISGSMTLLMGNDISAMADTWYVVDGEFDGSLAFDEFRTDEEPDLTGTATVPNSTFYFSGDAEYSVSAGDFTDDPGFFVFETLAMTFTSITVSDDGDSWTLGEGDWYMEISPGSSVTLDINSQTVEYDSSTYKLEDTQVYVEFGESMPESVPLFTAINTTTYEIHGTETNYGTFYHPVLGVIYFGGDLYEEDPPGDLVWPSSLTFYNDPDEGDTLFNVYFTFDESEGYVAYWIEIGMEYDEFGYIIEGTFTPDPSAAGNFM